MAAQQGVIWIVPISILLSKMPFISRVGIGRSPVVRGLLEPIVLSAQYSTKYTWYSCISK